jgi:hypothetical protein
MRIVANERIRPSIIPMTKIRYVPKEFTSSTSTYIFDGKVAIVIWEEPFFAILLEHRTVYESYRNHFEYLWRTAKK